VFGADPDNTVLKDKYDEIMAEYLVEDPQKVPESILERSGAVPAQSLLKADFWGRMVKARNLGLGRSRGWQPMRRAVEQVGISR
jgi:hypothetical protein